LVEELYEEQDISDKNRAINEFIYNLFVDTYLCDDANWNDDIGVTNIFYKSLQSGSYEIRAVRSPFEPQNGDPGYTIKYTISSTPVTPSAGGKQLSFVPMNVSDTSSSSLNNVSTNNDNDTLPEEQSDLASDQEGNNTRTTDVEEEQPQLENATTENVTNEEQNDEDENEDNDDENEDEDEDNDSHDEDESQPTN
jgi:hypothetical protein